MTSRADPNWIPLRDGRNLHVKADGAALTLVMRDKTGQLEHVKTKQPEGGYELVLSPAQRYLALFIYSGQSEVGYELFALEPRLRRLAGMDYVDGECQAPVFAPDDSSLALVLLSATFFERDAPERVTDWGELHVRALPDGPVATCALRVDLTRDCDARTTEPCYAEGLHFTTPHTIAFGTTWDRRVEVELPAPSAIVISGSAERLPAPPAKRVDHATFGAGSIVRVLDGDKAEVAFDSGSTKVLLRKFLRELGATADEARAAKK